MRDAYLINPSSCLDNIDSDDPDNIIKLSQLVTNVPKWVKADQKKLIIAAKEELTRLGKGWRWDAASYAIPDPNKMKIAADKYSISVDNNEISVCLYFYVVPKNIYIDDYDSPEDIFPHFSVNYDRRGWTGKCEWDQYDNEWFDYNYSK